jgi:hypothetical protein
VFVMEVAQVGAVFQLGLQVGVVKLGCSSRCIQVGVYCKDNSASSFLQGAYYHVSLKHHHSALLTTKRDRTCLLKGEFCLHWVAEGEVVFEYQSKG